VSSNNLESKINLEQTASGKPMVHITDMVSGFDAKLKKRETEEKVVLGGDEMSFEESKNQSNEDDC
jgi:hypothetical protein